MLPIRLTLFGYLHLDGGPSPQADRTEDVRFRLRRDPADVRDLLDLDGRDWRVQRFVLETVGARELLNSLADDVEMAAGPRSSRSAAPASTPGSLAGVLAGEKLVRAGSSGGGRASPRSSSACSPRDFPAAASGLLISGAAAVPGPGPALSVDLLVDPPCSVGSA